jgi:putative methyltransferase (TIGR04325 family)
MKIKDFIGKNKTIREYNHYDDALKNCPTQKAYENTELCYMIGDKTRNYIENLEIKPYALTAVNIFLTSIIQKYLLEFQIKDIVVLDFGGACGTHYFETRRFFGSTVKFKWIVVETPEMVSSAKNHGFENEEIFFVDSLEKINGSIDLVHSSGALQSVSNWLDYLKRLVGLNAKYMLFNRMMFNENDRTFVTIQKSRLSDNGPGPMPEKYKDKDIFYPHTTISYSSFNETIVEKGYGLEWFFEERSGSYQINNEKIIGRGLLYKRCE